MSGSVTHIRPMRSGFAHAAKAVLLVPYGALALFGVAGAATSELQLGLAALGALGFFAVWILVAQKPGKMPLAAISVVIWIVVLPILQVGLSRWMPDWMSYLAVATLMVLITLLVVGLMIEWRRQYCLTGAGGGCRTIEWEWIYVGREAARSHQLGRLSPSIGCVAAFLILCGGGHCWYALGQVHSSYLWVGIAIEALLIISMLWLLLIRHPAAYPLVFFLLGLNFPFSVLLLFFWADGVRPNLIYRHRFERLVPPEENTGELYV